MRYPVNSRSSRQWSTLGALAFVCLFFYLVFSSNRPASEQNFVQDQQFNAENEASQVTLAEAEPAIEAEPEVLTTTIEGELLPGESLDTSLKRLNVSAPIRLDIINALSQCLDFRKLRVGDRFAVALDEEGNLLSTQYISGPLAIYNVCRTEDGFAASREPIQLERRTELLSGTLNSSLFSSFQELGEEPKLVHAFADIFASRLDFNTESRVGDRFSLVVEKYYKDETFVGYGTIIAARYQQEDAEYNGFYFETASSGGYFAANGEELGNAFLRSPIPFGRVTSGFTHKRKHPVLGITRPHLGIDLAAPTGTPIMAVGDGKIAFLGRKGGYGNHIVIEHAGNMKTYYGHLNGFKKGLKTGSRVKQKDIIGYVGSTGLSTGPHLDYRLSVSGQFVNPFSRKFKPRTILSGAELARFQESTGSLANMVKGEGQLKIVEVEAVTLTEENPVAFL